MRHAEVHESYHQTFGGVMDIHLSENGHKQAATLSPFLEHYNLDAIYASPMRRVQQTLAPILESNYCDHVVFDEKLKEVDFGIWTGLKWHQVQEKHGLSAFDWLRHLEEGNIDKAEKMDDFKNRTQKSLQTILNHEKHERVLVACHGGVIRMLISQLLDLPLSKMEHFDADYASITEVHIRADKNEIKLLNFRPWAHHPAYV